MDVRVAPSIDVTVVELVGDLDLAARDEVRAALASALERQLRVLVDFSECTFVDVEVVRLLGEAHRCARELSLGYLIVLPFSSPSSVRRLVLELVPQLAPFAIVPSRAAAESGFARQTKSPSSSFDHSGLQALRASIWEAGLRRDDLLAQRDALILEQREALARRRRRTRESSS